MSLGFSVRFFSLELVIMGKSYWSMIVVILDLNSTALGKILIIFTNLGMEEEGKRAKFIEN